MALGKGEGDAGAAGGSLEKSKPDFKETEVVESKLDPQVKNLMKFIFDKGLMEKSMISLDVDISKMPLGELSKETVLKGYQLLRSIE